MSIPKGRRRGRVGNVSFYFHHGSWWLYFRENGKPVRQKVSVERDEAEKVVAQINGQLAAAAPTLLSFSPISISELRQQFLGYHENVLKSSMMTVSRYRAATQHLETFAKSQGASCPAHAIGACAFAAYLRAVEVAPNGHPNALRRKLRDKGVQFILAACRSMYAFAAKRRHLPPYSENPFAELPLDRFKIEDAKPIFVFDAQTELAFLEAADDWTFAIHFLLAKTGLRVGEAVHLLVDELDLEARWLRVRNKPALGWRVKTGTERDVPLLSEVVAVLRQTIGIRSTGPVFLRHRFIKDGLPLLNGPQRELERECEKRQRSSATPLTRSQIAKVCRSVWRDCGAVKADVIRTNFIRVMSALGHPEATCPKSWRHSFATLLQDANVDPLIRQITLGHRPSTGVGLGMTGNYTHTRPETQRAQIEAALRMWPQSLTLASAKFGKETL